MRRWKRSVDMFGHKPPKPKRQRPRKLEDPIHALCLNWLAVNIEGMVYHCPNGLDGGSEIIFLKGKPVSRAAVMWQKLVKLGARAGVLDLTIHWADESGLGRTAYLEIKSEAGGVSKGQKGFMADLDRCKIPYEVVRSLPECREAVARLGIPLRKFTVCARVGESATG